MKQITGFEISCFQEYYLDIIYEHNTLQIQLPDHDNRVIDKKLNSLQKCVDKHQNFGLINLGAFFDIQPYFISCRNVVAIRYYQAPTPVLEPKTAQKTPSTKKTSTTKKDK